MVLEMEVVKYRRSATQNGTWECAYFILLSPPQCMRECDPKDKLANNLIRVRSQITASQSTTTETHALTDVLQGMTDVLELASSKSSKRRSERSTRKNMADRLALIMEGLKRYSIHQTRRVETFACCVEAVGGNVKAERDRIKVMKEKESNVIKKLDDIIVELRGPNPGKQLVETAQRLQDHAHQVLQRSTGIWDIDKRLREEAERVIRTSLREDELARMVFKGLAFSSRDDPGAGDPV